MTLNVTLVGDDKIVAKLDAMPSKVHQALLAKITGLALELQAYVQNDKLAGQVLKKITGHLAGSIMQDVDDQSDTITGRVYSNSSVNYAAIHEFGGQIPARYPINGKALHFFIDGKEVFAKYARGFTMPERSFMRSALADKKQEIIAGMTKAVQQAVAE